MQYVYFDQQITTTCHMRRADLGHTITDTLHIFRAARVKAELRKQTGSSVPKARNLNDSASNTMVTGNPTNKA